ncbi:MAG: hypothetical protein R3F43_15800, partial [bacterium]
VVDGLTSPVTVTAFAPAHATLPGGPWVAVSTLDGDCSLHAPGQPPRALDVSGGVRAVDFRVDPPTGDLSWILSAGSGFASFHRPVTSIDRAPEGPPEARYDIAFAPSAAWFAFGGGTATGALLHRWRADGTALRALSLPPMRVSDVAISPDGQWIAALGQPTRVEIRHTRTARALTVDEPADIGSIAFLADALLLIGTDDGWLRIHDVSTDTPIGRLDLRVDPQSPKAQLNTLNHLVVADAQTVLVQQRTQVTALRLSPAWLEGLEAAPHRRLGREEAPVLWRLPLTASWHGTLTSDGDDLWVSGDGLGVLHALPDRSGWAAWGDSRALPRRLEAPTAADDARSRAHGLAPVPGTGRLVAAHADGTIRLHTAHGARVLGRHLSEANRVAVSPDGTRAYSAGDDATLRAWDLVRLRAGWRAPLLLPDPPRFLSHHGWLRVLDGPAGPWRTLDGLGLDDLDAGALSADGRTVCLLRGGRLELHRDGRAQASTPIGDPEAPLTAVDAACAVEVDGGVTVLDAHGARSLPGRVLLGDDGVALCLRVGSHTIERGGAVTQTTAQAPSACGSLHDRLVIGFAKAALEVHAGGRVDRFERADRSPVSHLRAGPAGTLVTGSADGRVELWDLQARERLHGDRLNGRVAHLHVDQSRVIAVSDLGDHLVWGLDALIEPPDRLLDRMQRAVPLP